MRSLFGVQDGRDIRERLEKECGVDMDKSVDAVVAELCGMLQQYNKEGIELTAATNLGSELNIDSVEVMDLIMEIEDKFDIDIPINLVADIERIDDLAKLVSQRMEGR